MINLDESASKRLFERLDKLTEVSIALSAQKEPMQLLEQILMGAKSLTHADGGTLYTIKDKNRAHFEIVSTDSLNFHMGGSSGSPITFADIPLYNEDHSPNDHMVVVYAAVHQTSVNVADAYVTKGGDRGFDFSGTRLFDEKTGYHSTSFLTVPMKDHEGEVIGVLQLINAQDPATGKVVSFSEADQRFIEALASQAAAVLTKQGLILGLKQLFGAVLKMLANAIDDKSHYTAGHCNRVPVIADLLARAVNRVTQGPLKDVRFSEDDLYELQVAAFLHDCGKIVTPTHIMDKATRLEGLYDKIHLIEMRFEILKRDAEIAFLNARLEKKADLQKHEADYSKLLAKMDEDFQFLFECNRGFEVITAEKAARIKAICQQYQLWSSSEKKMTPLITEEEKEDLLIPRGTLNVTEREVMKNHVVSTIRMLSDIPYPKHLKRVPEIAGCHHERFDGRGYPKGLRGEQMSVQARILAIADVFEALTAPDRPYKQQNSFSLALDVLGTMKNEGHIDPQLYDVFIKEKVYSEYAKKLGIADA